MAKKRTFNLLTKTTWVYLVFTFIAFFSSALFLTHEADEFIANNLDHRFKKSESRIERYVREGKSLKNLPYRITPLKMPPQVASSPVYSDTLIYNAELGEDQRFHKKTVVMEVDGQYYRAEIIKAVEDFLRLRDDIFGALIPAFVLLAASIVLLNYFLSGYLFKAFNRIMSIMRTYQVGQQTLIDRVETSTREFMRMQELFHRMLDRIERDYRRLKEYTENMAHELQTPLTVIRNKTENLIADESVMNLQADVVKIIYEEANHLSKLGTTLNLLTKVENNEFRDAVLTKTKPVLEKHIAAISELASLKGLTIESELSDEHSIIIDPHLLDVMLKNLLRNAVSYGSCDGPLRIISDQHVLEISNYGTELDFPAEDLFERFRCNNHANRKSLGLGLSLVRKICELNGLEIRYRYRSQQHIFSIVRKKRKLATNFQ